MEKKRRRDKNAANGSSEGALRDSGKDAAEHKEVAEGAPPYYPWLHQQEAAQQRHQQHQHQQHQHQQHQHQQPQQQPQQQQQLAAQESQPPSAQKQLPMQYWSPQSEFSFPPRPFLTTAPESWQAPAAQNATTNAGPYPFPGPWFAPYPPYPYPFYGCYPLPTTVQRGVIKPPQSLSQKHQKLWEQQSAENVLLWSTLARLETEVAAQRAKVVQLESELQALKSSAQETALNEATTTITTTTTTAAAATTAAGTATAAATTTQTLLAAAAAAAAAPKKGRLKKLVASTIPPESIAPRPRGRKPSADKPATLAERKQAGLRAEASNGAGTGSAEEANKPSFAAAVAAASQGSGWTGTTEVQVVDEDEDNKLITLDTSSRW